MRTAWMWFPLVLTAACATAQSSRNAESPQPADPRPDVIVRTTSWEDAGLAVKGLGRVEISVRVADQPARTVQYATITAKLAGLSGPARQAQSDVRGVAMFDSLAVGRYDIIVRAIGYGPARALVEVIPGCRTDVEAYLGISAVGIAPPPPEPSRIRITTCRASL